MTARKSDHRPIVCGTDFSTPAGGAVDVAAALARRLEAKLVLVQVEEFHGLASVDPSLFDVTLSKRHGKLTHEAERLRGLGTVVEPKVFSGSAVDELVTAVSECHGRLLVLGAVGHGLPRRFLVGSVAERAAETSPVPTMVVRPGTRLGSWLRGDHPLKVLVGYDFSAASDAALHWVNDLQEIGECEIDVVHIDWPPEQARRIGYHGALPLSDNPEEIQNYVERDLAERVAMYLPREKVTITVEAGWGHPEGYLSSLASEEEADLIVVGTHQRRGLNRLRFGSVSRAVLHHATISVAVVPPTDEHKPSTIPKLERVLVATDFSDFGNHAVPYGCALLHRQGRIKLIHVIEPESGPDVAAHQPRPGKSNPKLSSRLRALVPAVAAERLEIEEEIVESKDAATAIAQAAERFDADVICIGSHGRGGRAKTFLGSVAQGVVAQSERPVLVTQGS